MNFKNFCLVFAIALAVFALSACERSASTPPDATPTGSLDFPTPGGAVGTDTMGLFGAILTQTAAAQLAGEGTEPSASTPVPDPGEDPTQPQVQEPTQAVVQETTPVPQEPAQPVVVPTATPGLPSTYTLEKGEFPYCLARRFNINPADLLAANNLGVNTITYPGLALRIPQNARPFPGGRELRNHPTTYTAGANDTIYSIACLFGDVDPNSIAFANNLSAPYNLSAGQVLQIP